MSAVPTTSQAATADQGLAAILQERPRSSGVLPLSVSLLPRATPADISSSCGECQRAWVWVWVRVWVWVLVWVRVWVWV